MMVLEYDSLRLNQVWMTIISSQVTKADYSFVFRSNLSLYDLFCPRKFQGDFLTQKLMSAHISSVKTGVSRSKQ